MKLGEVCQRVFSGTWGRDPKESLITPMESLVSDIKEDWSIDYARLPLRVVKKRQQERYRLQPFDIVVVKSSGSKAKVISGRAALFNPKYDEKVVYLPSNFTLALRCRKEVVEPKFLWRFLNSLVAHSFVESIVGTTTYPNIKKQPYLEMPVPLPPLPEQRRIVAYLDQVQTQVTALQKAQESTEAELHRLEQAILDKAFRGEL